MGGLAWLVTQWAGEPGLLFCHDADQRLYWKTPGGQPLAVTPPSPEGVSWPDDDLRRVRPDGQDVQRLPRRQAQPLALADGEAVDAAVTAERVPLLVDDRAAPPGVRGEAPAPTPLQRAGEGKKRENPLVSLRQRGSRV